ncbi:methyl-accepting chemotaxis protein [Profundibacter sp.]
MRRPSLSKLSIRALIKVIVGALLAVTVFFGIVGFTSFRFISNTEAAWNEYKHANAPRAKALSSVVDTMGYGGMIHQFKNYIIRQDDGRMEKVRNRAAVALFALKRLELYDGSTQTVAAIAQVRSVINAYVANAEKLTSLVAAGHTANEIDAVLKIDDTPAIEGLETLFAQLRKDDRGALLSKEYYLGQLRLALGFNGMIHHFKNYVIRHDAPRVEKIDKAMDAANAALASYKALGITAVEQSAIDDIQTVLANYGRGLELAQKMVAKGVSTTEIDRQIKVDDGPALAGMAQLGKAIALYTDDASVFVSDNLSMVKTVNIIVSILIAIVATFISILIYLILNRGIARPATRIAHALEQLSNGDTDVEFDSMANDTEIGKIARVSNVFRDSLINNQRMADEQETFLKEQQIMATKQAHLLEEQKIMADKQQATADAAAEQRTQTDKFQNEMRTTVEAAAAGIFSNRILCTFSDPDLAGFTQSINSLIDGVDKGIAETTRVVTCLSESNLGERMEGDFLGTFATLQNSVNEALATLSAVIGNVFESAGRIASETSQISQASQQLSHRTEAQAETLGHTSTALNQLTMSVNSVAQGAQEVNAVVSDTKTYTEESAQVVVKAIEAMSAIEESSAEISKIISIINDIAFQTNLLSLNAGVEAARAGEAGRGFAVVASEVRGLAQRSSDAAHEIGVLINKSGDEVSRGVALVDHAGDSLKRISSSVASIASHIENVATSASEQAVGLTEINAAISQLDEVTQQNVAMLEETTASTLSLSQETDTLFDTVSMFNTDLKANLTIHATNPADHIKDIDLAS